MADVLTFPRRDKGRIRRRRSPMAMGRCSITILERNGETPPEHVEDIRAARSELFVEDGSLALRLAIATFAVLSAKQKQMIRCLVATSARHDDNRCGDECRILLPLLTGERLGIYPLPTCTEGR